MIEKIYILGFLNEKMTQAANPSKFVIPVNPENMTRTFKIEREGSQAAGTQHNNQKQSKTKNEDLKFDVILDNTNTIENYAQEQRGKIVPDQINDFLDVTYKMVGEVRKPNHLKIVWGTYFTFDCVLTSLNISYNLFDSKGMVLRAKLSVAFEGFVEPTLRVIKEDKSRESLTKVLDPKALMDESFPHVIHKAYQSTGAAANPYMQVAKNNNIINFRGIKEKSNLILSPLQDIVGKATDAINTAAETANNINNTINRLL